MYENKVNMDLFHVTSYIRALNTCRKIVWPDKKKKILIINAINESFT